MRFTIRKLIFHIKDKSLRISDKPASQRETNHTKASPDKFVNIYEVLCSWRLKKAIRILNSA